MLPPVGNSSVSLPPPTLTSDATAEQLIANVAKNFQSLQDTLSLSAAGLAASAQVDGDGDHDGG